ncbi:helix-turn-helix transcriptional regulator [Neolewinella aurantiaca]|uniref:Helix-turn-helix transcriptional regulator n=1 Tax=Neolewinella aurantiaca TaxID=2602767 RepID=A0A5C7FDQ9_9BACT|nr:metalloregulator ArsR/SmtB family transcription factor [Neolewinella aurantiaca]TXF88358.1 helix-turn-helix transcriptional regulator [Neolewinella aurantiaca]
MELSNPPQIKQRDLDVSSEILRALAHPLRMRILEFIDQNKLINVNKIYSSLNLEQSITSQHLRILRQTGLVATEREGKFIHYKLNYDRLHNTVAAIKTYQAAIADELPSVKAS